MSKYTLVIVMEKYVLFLQKNLGIAWQNSATILATLLCLLAKRFLKIELLNKIAVL
jgi:hypothetical protein